MDFRLFAAVLLCSAACARAGDSVWVEPSSPTDQDSITFNLFDLDMCCCAVVHGDTVGVVDTVIALSYSVDEAPCQLCRCFAAGAWIAFKTGPLAAGTYAVYKLKSLYCPPGQACILVAPQYARVGEVTVRSTTVSREAVTSRSNGSAARIRHSPGESAFSVEFERDTKASIEVYAADGRRIATLARNRRLARGTHTFSLSGRHSASGAVTVAISTPDNTFARVVTNTN